MRISYFIIFVTLVCSLGFRLDAELLILKKDTATGYLAVLTPAELISYGPLICQVLLKYQWPMCLASDLTQREKNELLAVDIPCAEELFIEKKLKEVFVNIDLEVVFIPTSLYELFEIIEFFTVSQQSVPRPNFNMRMMSRHNFNIAKSVNDPNANSSNANSSNANSFMSAAKYIDRKIKADYSALDNDLVKILNLPIAKNQTPAHIRKKVFDVYASMNNTFYTPILSQDVEIPALSFNADLIHFLSSHIPDFLKVSKGSDVTKKIIDNVMPILTNMINKFNLVYNPMFLHDSHKHTSQLNVNVIYQVVAIEYGARILNKALLFRGSKLITVPVGQGKTAEIIGHTFYAPTADKLLNTIAKSYKGNPEPFTISLGSSLFAGYINNQGGCAYSYLTMQDMVAQNFTGSVLFINKKDQYEHDSSRLFFIPPLAPIAALFQYGYLFHPRVKAAVKLKDVKIEKILGATGVLFQDPAGILIITCDPLRHASLFSDFVAKNSVLIEINQTANVQDRSDKILQAQDLSTKFYKALNTIKKHSPTFA